MTKLFEVWRKVTTGSTNRKIFGAAIVVGTWTAFAKLVAVIKELVVAWKFGTGDKLDAYLIATVVPFFLITVIGNSFNTALMPCYIQVKETKGKIAAQKLLSEAISLALGLLTITSILMVMAAPLYLPLMTKGFEPQKYELTFKLLCTLVPFILLCGMIIISGGVLNSKENFVLAAFTPTFVPLITIIILLSFESWGSFTLVAGLIGGALLELIVLGIALKRKLISLMPKWYSFSPHLRQVVKLYLPTVAGSLLMCTAPVVDQSMAAMLSPGSVAALSYSDKVVSLPIFLTTTALNTAVTPYFSKMFAYSDWIGIEHTLKRYLKLIFLFTVPITVVLILSSEMIVKLLFERGSFTASDTQLVAEIQNCYALQIPFYISAVFLVKLIVSLQKNHILIWGSAINLLINILGNLLLMGLFDIKGIALSTSCVYFVSFAFLLFFSLKYIKELSNNPRESQL